ncbi:MAG TPA: sugar phosphate nucleotidyltransferase [Nitratidesulfovibrio sp.]|nr:sugar phosphate nucleotidyltransferase [Nitratidesulfovibrio sp.]
MKAIIQAGGKGTRLRPYTLVLPKPLVPVGGIPVIEVLLRWLRRNGVEECHITTGYLSHLIQAVCGDGSQWDQKIFYSFEQEPMGTVGALHLIGKEQLTETFIMLNGDVITDLNLRDFIRHHKETGGIATIACASKPVKVDLGVIDAQDGRMTRFREKPELQFNVSMGIYCLEPEILDYIPRGVAFGFDDLMYTLLDKGVDVHIFEHKGMWMDIGRPEDHQKAQEIFAQFAEPIIGS